MFSFSSIVSIVASSARGLSEHSRIVYRPWKYKLLTPLIILYMWYYTCTEPSQRPGRNICYTTTHFSDPSAANKTLEVAFWKEKSYILIAHSPKITMSLWLISRENLQRHNPVLAPWIEGPLHSPLKNCNTRLGRWELVDCGSRHCSWGLGSTLGTGPYTPSEPSSSSSSSSFWLADGTFK